MQIRKQQRFIAAIFTMTILSVLLLSFIPGGDHYEVYLNKKLIFQHFVTQPGSLKSFTLDERNIDDKVDVFYSHCGKLGNKRSISISDGKTVLKKWRFADDANNKFMSVGAKEILAFQNKNTDRKLNLYYSSEEIPGGKLLASIILDSDVNKAVP